MIQLNLRTGTTIVLVGCVIAMQTVEQATQGRFQTPTLIGHLATLAVGFLYSAEGIVAFSKMWAKKGEDKDD